MSAHSRFRSLEFHLFAGLVAAALTIWLASAPVAAPPQTMSFQGFLTNASSVPVNGTVAITFRLYSVSSGGSALWTEAQPSVSVANGVYNVTLGSVTPIGLPFDVPYYLGVTVGADAEMAPRLPLVSTGYSFRAAQADAAATATTATTAATATTATTAASATTAADVGGLTAAQLRRIALDNVPTANTSHIPTKGGGAGKNLSISILGDGRPIVASQVDAGDVAVFTCTSAECTGTNFPNAISTTAATTPVRLVIGADGLPLVSHGANKVTRCLDMECATSTTATLAPAGTTRPGFAVGKSGIPFVVYAGGTGPTFAPCASASCGAFGTPSVPEESPTGTSGFVAAMSPQGYPWLAFVNGDTLFVWECWNASCIDNGGVSISGVTGGQVYSLGAPSPNFEGALGRDGLPAFAFIWPSATPAASGLKIVRCGDTLCSGSSTITLVPSGPGARTGPEGATNFPSITIPPDGLPMVTFRGAYYEGSSGSFPVTSSGLIALKCTKPDCSSYVASLVDGIAGQDLGEYSAVTIGQDGLPVIAYRDATNDRLKIVKCANAFCASYFARR